MPGSLNIHRCLPVAVSLIVCSGALAEESGPDVQALSALRPAVATTALMPSPNAVRHRPVELDLAAIAPDLPGQSPVEFRLFEGTEFLATRESVRVLGEGRWSWVGSLDDEPAGMVQFAVRDGVASGIIRSPERGVFRVRFTGEPGVYLAEQIDDTHFERCATGARESIARPGDVSTTTAPDRPDGQSRENDVTSLDVLVGYTTQARSMAGGASAMLAEIDLAVASANLAYQNSGVSIDLNLVLTYLAQYNESGSAFTELSRWKRSNDGVMDDVHDQRDDIAADLCALIVGNFNACGIGYLMTSPSASFEDRAFTVTELGCSVNNLSFAHEIGHNLGCAHDRGNADSGAYSFSFGYRDPVGTADWRTIMAYLPGTRIQYFSSPQILYQGQLTGVQSGSSSADNSRTMNQTRLIAEDWRDASTRRPIEFDLSAPGPGGLVGGDQVFAWEAAGPVDSYSLIIATDPELVGEVYRVDGLLDNEYTIAGGVLDECSAYYWGVVATLAGNSRSALTSSQAFTTSLASDINTDGVVDTADLGGLTGAFGTSNALADINRDGVVDTADLGTLIGSFGQACTP